jgi:hypothetical protein
VCSVAAVTAVTSRSSGILSQEKSITAPTPPIVKDTRDLSRYGSVEYDLSQASEPHDGDQRIQKSQRYDGMDWVYKTINNPRTAGVGRITDEPSPPRFPEDSSLVILGKVVKADAFLSNDKGGVYTEYTILTEEIFKNSDDVTTKTVIADREGGVVLYPHGQRVLYQSTDRALPEAGSDYVFFLAKDRVSPNYLILTSYELSSRGVRPMELIRPTSDFPKDKNQFIEIVRKSLARIEKRK